MVPMSLPIAIPAQLRGPQVQESRMIKGGTPAKAESGLGRSLKAQAAIGSQKATVALAAPRLDSSLSDSDDDDPSRSGASSKLEDGGFVPPHTLVDQPFFSFAKVRHLGSFKEKPALQPAQAMRVQHHTEGQGGSNGPASPFASSQLFVVPMSSSVPRITGSLGARQMVSPTAASTSVVAPSQVPSTSSSSAAGPKLGFVANNTPAPKSASNAGVKGPSSRAK